MIKLTPNQAVRVRHLVRSLCANCDEDGNYYRSGFGLRY